MSKTHRYRQIPLPVDAPFKLKPSADKGWGAFATRDIERGSIIATEKPLFILRNIPPQHVEFEQAFLHVAFERDIQSAVQNLAPAEKRLFLLLRKDPSSPFTHRDTFCDNSFMLDPPESGYGVYLLLSRFNHACVPNAHLPRSGKYDELSLHASKDIRKGEEITFLYISEIDSKTRNLRQKILLPLLEGPCTCKTCCLGPQDQLLSDMRRTLIRGLRVLMFGYDAYDDYDEPRAGAPPIISDPVLRKELNKGPMCDIPLSSFFVWHVLAMFLLEEEGLLNDVERAKREPTLVKMAALFEVKDNASVIRKVMAEKDLGKRLGMALRISGRRDAADWNVGGFLMMSRAQGMLRSDPQFAARIRALAHPTQ